MSTEDTSTDKQKSTNILKDLRSNLTKNDVDIINEISTEIYKKYGLYDDLKKQNKKKPKGKSVFSFKFNNNIFSSFGDNPDNTKTRANILLNNISYVKHYFENTDSNNMSYEDFVKYITEFKDGTTPESEKQAQQTITNLEADKEQLTKKNEDLAQQRNEAQQAFKDSKDIQHQKFADQSNNIKDLQDKNDKLQDKLNDYEQRFKELEKAPLKRNYINDKVFNESYSLDKGELINVILNDINKGKLPEDTNPEEIADAIYAKATKRIYKNLKRINNITALTGYNPDIYNKLPAEVAEIIKNHINDKIQEDIRKKNIRYILPKEKPRWEKAMQKYNLNPMLGRGAYTI